MYVMDFGWQRCVNLLSTIVNKYAAPLGDVDNGGNSACVGSKDIWKSLHLPINFAVNLKLS